MSDDADLADLQINATTEIALQHIRQQRYHGESAVYCDECGDPIPQARREALPGVKHCIGCVKTLERERLGLGRYRE